MHKYGTNICLQIHGSYPNRLNCSNLMFSTDYNGSVKKKDLKDCKYKAKN